MCIYGLSSDGQSDTGCGHMDSYRAPKISSPASLKQFDCHQERKQTDVGFFCHSTTLCTTLYSRVEEKQAETGRVAAPQWMSVCLFGFCFDHLNESWSLQAEFRAG